MIRFTSAVIALLALPAAAQPTTRAAPDPPWRCGEKRYCTQMTSCAEAMFHFRQCGLARLDGDRDGVPCEALCGRGGRGPPRRR
jgi:hypothetical protein